MNLIECIAKNGIQMEVDNLKQYQIVDIAFINSDGIEDEAEFTVAFLGTRTGTTELSKLFADFCQENGFKKTTVISVTVVKSADTLNELRALDK